MVNFIPSNRFWPETHEIENLPKPLESYNLFTSDTALQEAIKHHSSCGSCNGLSEFGEFCGKPEVIELGFQANNNKPELFTHSRYGQRIDEVRYHPSYHKLMKHSLEQGIHASHWDSNQENAQVVRAAKSYLMTQVDAGHGCPITMTSASIPTLKRQPNVYNEWAPKILHRSYDHRNVPFFEKESVTIGMAMTEKQGGSDVRQNSTYAFPLREDERGYLYELVGHKYFVSAPMSDAFLVLAQTEKGVSCFLVPRWRSDGSKNPIQIQTIKNKMGNVSNASTETELRGAQGWLVGEEGKGVSVILEMVAMTRFDCMIGSSAGMRQAVTQITHYCANRSAFGRVLNKQPLMQNVLADLILESEASIALTMRIARALDNAEASNSERNFVRMGTAIGKYWICKRASSHAYEAMECIGGMGVMEDTIMPRLYREAPVNSIWEGSGNVQCLDMIRALKSKPQSMSAFIDEIENAKGMNKHLDKRIEKISANFRDDASMEYRSRQIVEDMALAVQASSLFQFTDGAVAEAFCQARLDERSSGLVYGTLPVGVDCEMLINRASVS